MSQLSNSELACLRSVRLAGDELGIPIIAVGAIQWPGSALKMNVFGFSDAHENAIELELAPDFRLPVATIPLLAALKFFAFSDRCQDSDRDLFDLWHIMRNYVSSGRESELFDEPLSSVANDDFDWEYAPSLLLGYDIGRACKPATIKKLLPILNHFIDPYSGNIGKLIARTFSQEQEEAERRRVCYSFLWLAKGLGIARSGS